MSERNVRNRQHVVNGRAGLARTSAGDAFTDLVLEVAWLGGIFTAKGEAMAKLADQTLARWVILDAIEEAPTTVAQIARRRGIARQAVQRVADLLERDGLAVYEANPGHRRAKQVPHSPSKHHKLGADKITKPLRRLNLHRWMKTQHRHGIHRKCQACGPECPR